MVGGHSTIMSPYRGAHLFTLVSLCLLHASRGGPVAKVKVDWLFPWNISCTTCAPPDPTLMVHCRQPPPMYPFRLHCKMRFTPRVSVFASTITAVAKLDGKFIASNFEGSSPEACTDIGFGPCPWLANETYSWEVERTIGGNLWGLPKIHSGFISAGLPRLVCTICRPVKLYTSICWIIYCPMGAVAKGHYELKAFATNQDEAIIACISCHGDVKHYQHKN